MSFPMLLNTSEQRFSLFVLVFVLGEIGLFWNMQVSLDAAFKDWGFFLGLKHGSIEFPGPTVVEKCGKVESYDHGGKSTSNQLRLGLRRRKGYHGEGFFGNHPQIKMSVSRVMGVPKNGWFIRENPIKMDDLGVSRVSGTTQITHSVGDVFCTAWCKADRWNSRKPGNHEASMIHHILFFHRKIYSWILEYGPSLLL